MDEGSESEQRITRHPTPALYAAVAVVVAAAVAWMGTDVLSSSEGRAAPDPPPTTTPPTSAAGPGLALAGVPLEAPTGLEVLVGGTLVDVDRDLRTWVGGLDERPDGRAAGMDTFQVGPDTVIVRYFACEGCGRAEVRVLALSAGATGSEQILAGDGSYVAPGLDGMWVVNHGVDTCTARKVAIDGTSLVPPSSIRCGWSVRAETPLGLLADSRLDPDGVPIPTTFLLDPTDLSVRFSAPAIIAASHDRMLVRAGPGDEYELRGLDAPGEPFPAPEGVVARRGAVSPDGRYVALEARLDEAELWVADLDERRWERVPVGVPAGLVSHDWAADGRLVLFGPLVDGLGDRDGALATWRPGDEHLAVRPVDYPSGQLVVRRPG